MIFLCNRGANGIDGLISSGIGAAHATGKPTTIVTGDLGLLHDIGGLAALRDVSTPVRIVVIDNDGGGIFHFLPQQEALGGDEFEALLGTPAAWTSPRPQRSSTSPTAASTLSTTSPDALAAGTGLIEVRTDRQENIALHRRHRRPRRERSRTLVRIPTQSSTAGNSAGDAARLATGPRLPNRPEERRQWRRRQDCARTGSVRVDLNHGAAEAEFS